ncbi:MAG: hypothetical protein ACK52I_22275 [Pseudomonadota bacterium]|jgi:hypothetical protein
MELYIVKTDHILINKANPDQISLKDQIVIGIAIENLPDSSDDLQYGLNEAPKITLAPGDGARAYGGFQANNMPMVYDGYLQVKYPDTATAPRALVIITYITPQTKKLC